MGNPTTTTSKLAPLCLLGFATYFLMSCGAQPKESASDLMWVQSRADTARYAYLESSDLNDVFVFGANVINTSKFLSSALDMSLEARNVTLALEDSLLQVNDGDSGMTLMSFGVKETPKGLEVDFGSAGNDVRLRQLLDLKGGIDTSKDINGYWVSQGAPKVVGIQQDRDTLVVDLEHKVAQGLLDHKSFNVYLNENPSFGTVIVRLFLKRKTSITPPADNKTVAEGAKRNFGFFGPTLDGGQLDQDGSKIQRVPTPVTGAGGSDAPESRSITFYLKDVPEKYTETARRALLGWNRAFGKDVIKVKIAPESMDAGDPRYNVVRWYDGTDTTIQWAGVARMLVEPDTGVVMGGAVYIMGNKLEEIYQGIVSYSYEAAARAELTLGNTAFVGRSGETPVIPFFTNTNQSFTDYMEGYYEETISHEVGHYLGLRHNFAGSTLIDNYGFSSSIMDYAPRKERSNRQGPGSYDVAAIQWSYLNNEPSTVLPFCTDEDLDLRWDCNHGDFGNPALYAEQGMTNGIKLLTSTAIPVKDNQWISSMGDVVKTGLKILKLQNQLPPEQRATTVAKITNALRLVVSAAPQPDLTAADQTIVANNLDILRQVITGKK